MNQQYEVSARQNTIARKHSGQNYILKTESELKVKQNLSLKKEFFEPSSPKKSPTLILKENFHPKPMSTIQTINTDRFKKNGLNDVQYLRSYLVFIYRICKITKNLSSKSTFMERIHHLSLSKIKSIIKLPHFN